MVCMRDIVFLITNLKVRNYNLLYFYENVDPVEEKIGHLSRHSYEGQEV